MTSVLLQTSWRFGFETERLMDDTTLAGEIWHNVSTTGTDADWSKVIDVFPNEPETPEIPYLKMSNYHMMVRRKMMEVVSETVLLIRNLVVMRKQRWISSCRMWCIPSRKGTKSNPDSEYLVSFDRLESANFVENIFMRNRKILKKQNACMPTLK
jgi:hypothetical protein